MAELRQWKRQWQEESAQLLTERNSQMQDATVNSISETTNSNSEEGDLRSAAAQSTVPTLGQNSQRMAETEEVQHPEEQHQESSETVDLPPATTTTATSTADVLSLPDPDDITLGGIIEIVEQRKQENPDFHAKEKLTRFAFTKKARRLGNSHGTVLQMLERVFRHLTEPLVMSDGNDTKWMQVILDSRSGLDFAIVDLYR